MKKRVLKSMPMYDRGLKARVFPWTHEINSWIGYTYIFDDRDKEDMLIYFVPIEGVIEYRVHRTKATLNVNAIHGYTLDSEPDPDTDEELGEWGIGPARP